MNTYIVSAKDQTESNLLDEFFKKMNLKARLISLEEQEDLGLLLLMNEVDRSETVPESEIFRKLQKR